MRVATQLQTKALAGQIAQAIALAGLSDEDMAPRQILHTDLPWQAPPLLVSAPLGAATLQDYLDVPLDITQDDLMTFWRGAMHDLWHTPYNCTRSGGYVKLARLAPKLSKGQRQLRFALPPCSDGVLLDLTAGLQLSLEVAHTALISLPVRHHEMTLSDYWVETADGTLFGVRNGRPIIDSPWDYDGTHEIFGMLEAPRGPVSTACLHDPIASMRSILHTHPGAFRKDFEGVDIGLQALRCLTLGSYCPSLVTAVQVAPQEAKLWREREKNLREAREIWDASGYSDRQKLRTIEALLVPVVMTPTRFKREIFSHPNYPFMLETAKFERIKEKLYLIYETEVPAQLRRTN